jgi:hypothetical protein
VWYNSLYKIKIGGRVMGKYGDLSKGIRLGKTKGGFAEGTKGGFKINFEGGFAGKSAGRKKTGKWVTNDTRDYRFDPSEYRI